MKRDIDLIKAILLLAEAEAPGKLVRDLSPLGSDELLVTEHVWLAYKSGLIDASFLGDNPANGAAVIKLLTPAGHDFLSQAREPVLWNKAKETASKAGVGLTVDVMKSILTQLAAAALKAHLPL